MGRTLRGLLVLSAVLALPLTARGQQEPAGGLLLTRSDLVAIANRADSAVRSRQDVERNANIAASARQRLNNGDFQPGDRILLNYQSDTEHRDTLIVRATRDVVLPWKTSISLAGVLRSEAGAVLESELRKYVKAGAVEVIPLMRVGILGEVARPGYFAFPSDMPLTEVLMGAGGPTAEADMRRTSVTRGGRELKSPAETSHAISAGLTLDQFGLSAGDELVVAARPQGRLNPTLTILGAMASLVTVYVALGHR